MKLPMRYMLLWIGLSLSSILIAQKPPAITGISHVVFYANDIARSKVFYGDLLGWVPEPATGTSQALRFYPNHNQYVEVIPPPSAAQPNRLHSVGFATSDAEALRQYLASKGVTVPASVTIDPRGTASFSVQDPEENLVEFTQQGKQMLPTPSPSVLAGRLSTHIMHAGYIVRDRQAMDHFYKDILGFHLYWQGGAKSGDVDWVMMQVPDGTDWIEYMLYLPAAPTRGQLGSADHIAPGVEHVGVLQKRLEQRGWKPAGSGDPQVLGVDGKLQLDLTDPDGTRVEFMEFKPVKPPCCSIYTGRQPVNVKKW